MTTYCIPMHENQTGSARQYHWEDANSCISRHPYLAQFFLAVAAPVGLVLSVTAIAFAVLAPLSWLLGWL